MFGKTMSIPDELLENYFELVTDVPVAEYKQLLATTPNPRDCKIRLSKEIVALYHGGQAADEAVEYFVETFSKRVQPIDAEEVQIPQEALADGFVSLPTLIVALGFAKSNGAVKDLIKQGAVSLDGEKVSELRLPIDAVVGKTLKVGKHHFRRLV